MSDTRYEVTRLDEIARQREGRLTPIRAHFGIEAFGITAWTAGEADAQVINDHDEAPSGQQELYYVLAGHAVFTVDGREVDAPAGTFVFVEPETRRAAIAREPGTTVLALGAKPGEAHRPLGWEWSGEAYPLFETGEYERAYEILTTAAEEHPDAGVVLYNLACAEARTGRADDAIEHLRRAIELFDGFRDGARDDPDFESIRDRADFATA